VTRWEIDLEIPLSKPLPSANNLREHWAVKANRVKASRLRTAAYLRTKGAAFLREWRVMSGNEALRLACTLTRIAPRELDDDNLQGAFKGIRDQVAEECGIDDGSKRWDWRYAQAKGAPAIRIRLEVLTREVAR
jgi:hypothetical protein